MADQQENCDAEIVICVHNALDDVRRCLTSVTAHTATCQRLLLIDDASGQDCREELERFAASYPTVMLLRNDDRLGYTRSANRGLRESRAGLVVLLNSDTIVTPGWLERLQECAGSDRRIGIVGPLSNAATFQSVPERYNGGRDWALNSLPGEWLLADVAAAVTAISPRTFPRVGVLNGFCFAIKRSVIEAIGYFDEHSFPDGYGEEVDYCLRATKAGFALAVADHAYVYHAANRSYGPEQREALKRASRAVQLAKHGSKRIRKAISKTSHELTLAKMREELGALLNGDTSFSGPDLKGGPTSHSVVRRSKGKKSGEKSRALHQQATIRPLDGEDVGSPRWPDGMNVAGYFRVESGIGAAGRGYVRALEDLKIPIALRDLSHLSRIRSEDVSISDFDTEPEFSVTLICANASQMHRVAGTLGDAFFKDRYTIGVWQWELPTFPDVWHDRFAYFNELWVGSSFVANSLAPVSPVPVIRIPPVLRSTSLGSRATGRERLGVSDTEFVFLFIFSFFSYFERKNPLAVIDGFSREFSPDEPVRLIIKCTNEGFDPASFATMQAAARSKRISIYAGFWSSDEMRDLMAGCDAYVSLHRAEGIGLTIADAMALGKPVIGTGWSGNMDFMNVSNSFPVKFKLVKLSEDVGPYQAGEVWAEPSVEHAREQMRRVFENRAEARARGAAAQTEIATNYSRENVGRLIHQRLAVISGNQQIVPREKRRRL